MVGPTQTDGLGQNQLRDCVTRTNISESKVKSSQVKSSQVAGLRDRVAIKWSISKLFNVEKSFGGCYDVTLVNQSRTEV